MRRSPLIAAAALTTACAAAFYEPAGFDTVDDSYAVGGGTWSTGGGITAVAGIEQRGGNAAVCGAWATDRQSTLSYPYNADVMATGSVYAGDTRLVQDLGFMQRVDRPADLAGAQARCVDTGIAWRPEFVGMAPRFEFPRFSIRDDDDLGGSDTTFRQTPREAPLG